MSEKAFGDPEGARVLQELSSLERDLAALQLLVCPTPGKRDAKRDAKDSACKPFSRLCVLRSLSSRHLERHLEHG